MSTNVEEFKPTSAGNSAASASEIDNNAKAKDMMKKAEVNPAPNHMKRKGGKKNQRNGGKQQSSQDVSHLFNFKFREEETQDFGVSQGRKRKNGSY